MIMNEKQYYAAIDLGTTNSVIAYGNMQGNKMKPIVLELDRKADSGTTRGKTLPSVVFYYKNANGDMVADVGDYAKSRYGIIAGHVCKSVKSSMGVTDTVALSEDVPDKTPAEVSSKILSFMINASKKRLRQMELRDVVITVPASFDSDQCQATLDAAKKAGINVENMHDILLYEPKAVIYDFMRMQEDGEIPTDLLSLDTDKNILVFDLGGGTLDVTLHRVGYSKEGILNIKDLAISRYTRIGGDNFDELLAMDMLKKFEDMYDIKVGIKRREEVLCKLRKKAEHLKMDIGMQYEESLMMGEILSEDTEYEVSEINLYDSYSFEYSYTRAEVEEILKPLLGEAYTKEDVSKIQRMNEKDVNNIIYPVLDVLEKAGKDTKIDAVLLNGGMTKFYMIKQRLKDFFGFEPLETADPDLAVARGAVYYHYCLHKYNVRSIDAKRTMEPEALVSPLMEQAVSQKEAAVEKQTPAFCTGTILNDSINLGLRGAYVSRLLSAGTELPYRSEEIRDLYKLDKKTNTIGIELYLGRGETKNIPNRRISTRTVKFAQSYPAGTPISFQIYINSMRMMTMEAWITDHPETKTVMEMDMASLKNAEKTEKVIGTTEKIRQNAKSELNELKSLAERNKNRSTHDLNAQIQKKLNDISQALNPEDFFEPCMSMIQNYNQSDLMLGYVYAIAISFKDGWNEAQKKRILNVAKRHFGPYASAVKQNGYVLRKALEVIAMADPDFTDFYRDYFTRVPGEKEEIRQSAFQCVLTYEADDTKVGSFFEEFFKAAEMNKGIMKKLIARYGRGTDKSNQKTLAKLVKMLADALKKMERNDMARDTVILLSELCSGDVENPLMQDKYIKKPVWNAVEKYLVEETDDVYSSAIRNIWNGVELTEEEAEELVSFF